MNRASFLGGFAFVIASGTGHGRLAAQTADDISDPANGANTQALRVLLGSGDAQRTDAQTFVFEGRRYRGTFTASPAGIVNTLPLEHYLYGVVSREMPHSWPVAALQAQAIVARTYVLQRSNPTRDYDLVPSEADQVYTGVDAERPQTSAAVDATAGSVLRFENGFAQVMYSSCCGGHTEASSQAWNGPVLAYLGGVACPYCVDSPWFRWIHEIDVPAVQSALARQFAAIGDLQTIELDPPDASGRAKFWTFTGSTGTQRIKAADIRRALGTRTLPSLLVRRVALAAPSQPLRTISIEGSGLGHGVGLCQWGARGMALTGAGARAILGFYYPGTGIGSD